MNRLLPAAASAVVLLDPCGAVWLVSGAIALVPEPDCVFNGAPSTLRKETWKFVEKSLWKTSNKMHSF